MEKSTYTASPISMAYTNFSINYQLNNFFKKNTDLRKKLEERYNVGDLIALFPYIDTECKKD